jgi:hypothetical protein
MTTLALLSAHLSVYCCAYQAVRLMPMVIEGAWLFFSLGHESQESKPMQVQKVTGV